MHELQTIEQRLNKLGVDFGFYLESMEGESLFHHQPSKLFPFASCYKIAVMGAILDGIEQSADLAEMLTVTNADFHPIASGVLNQFDLPTTVSLRTLLRLMMVNSDGAATDILQRRLGTEKLNAYLKKIDRSLKVSHDISGLIDRLLQSTQKPAESIRREDFERVVRETTSTEDFGSAEGIVALLKHVYGSGPLHREFLLVESSPPRMNAYLDPRTKIKGKTGTLGYFASTNDCGYVIRDGQPIAVFSLLTVGWKQPRYLVEHTFAEIGRDLSRALGCVGYSLGYGSA